MREDFEELARGMQEGKEQAFVDFADEAGPWLRRKFLARGLPPADAEAMAVSAITDVALRIHKFKFNETGGFRSWVWTLAFRSYLDQVRKRRPGLLEIDSDPPAPRRFDPAFDDDADQCVLVETVREAVDALGEPDRTIVRFKLDDPDLTFGAIGESIGMASGTVRVRHHRALSKLADLLNARVVVQEWRRRWEDLQPGERFEGTHR